MDDDTKKEKEKSDLEKGSEAVEEKADVKAL
jgi:hypothetical protein